MFQYYKFKLSWMPIPLVLHVEVQLRNELKILDYNCKHSRLKQESLPLHHVKHALVFIICICRFNFPVILQHYCRTSQINLSKAK